MNNQIICIHLRCPNRRVLSTIGCRENVSVTTRDYDHRENLDEILSIPAYNNILLCGLYVRALPPLSSARIQKRSVLDVFDYRVIYYYYYYYTILYIIILSIRFSYEYKYVRKYTFLISIAINVS